MCRQVLSHPDKKLITHLKNVKEIGLSLFGYRKTDFQINSNKIKNVLDIILFFHDFGKATLFFQDYLKSKIEKSDLNNSLDLTHHSLISACITAYKIKEKLNNSNYADFLSLLGFLAVRKHHGNFDNLDEMVVISNKDWKILEKQFNNICSPFDKYIKNYSFEDIKNYISDLLWLNFNKSIENYILLNYLFSLLTYSDKTDVILGEAKISKFPDNISEFVNNYKKSKFRNSKNTNLNQLREEVYLHSLENLKKVDNNQNIFSLNLPTGAGKTLTVLNLSFSLLKKDKSLKRIIYALPFTSIIDQLELIVKDILNLSNLNPDDYFTVHHHLVDIKIKQDENYFEGDKAQFLIENWDKPIILTTFWQLFNSIITNKNSRIRKFHNIANSIIILDEVQSIPYKYWKLTNKVFTALTEIFNCKIVFLTATMPLIFRKDLNEIIPLIPEEKRNEYYNKFSRYNLKMIDNLEGITTEELYDKVKYDIENNPDKSFLFVFNTIKSSIKFFDFLKNDFENSTDKELIYLSTNILPYERKKRIEKIKENPKNKIIVSTQLIEAGVDIDIDIVYRDFAPLDSIIQTAGRCNRNNRDNYKGIVNLFKLKNENGRYDYSYIYQGLTLSITNEILKERNYFEESDLLNLINEFFGKIKENHSTDESRNLIKFIEKLEYENIAKHFKIIDEIPSILLFVEINDNAKNILKEFKNALQIDDRFKRKNELLKIKSSFYQFVLSVKLTNNNIAFLESFENIGDLKILNDDLVNQYYLKDTGLNLEFDNFI